MMNVSRRGIALRRRTIFVQWSIVLVVAMSIAVIVLYRTKPDVVHSGAEQRRAGSEQLPAYFLIPGYEKNLDEGGRICSQSMNGDVTVVRYEFPWAFPPYEFLRVAQEHFSNLGWSELDYSLLFPLDRCGSDAGWVAIRCGREWTHWWLKDHEAMGLHVIQYTNRRDPTKRSLFADVTHHTGAPAKALIARYRAIHPLADGTVSDSEAHVQTRDDGNTHECDP